MIDPGQMPEWLKDIGGWGVVLLIVRWMMTRIDALIASSESNMKAAIQEFKDFRVQEQLQHSKIEDSQQEILEAIRRYYSA